MPLLMEAAGRFGQALAAAIDERDLPLKELAQEVGISYEHLRKLVRNDAQPSKPLLKVLCKTLDLSYSEMEQYIARDKMEKKFGKSAYLAFGKDPRIAEFEQLIPHLTEE